MINKLFNLPSNCGVTLVKAATVAWHHIVPCSTHIFFAANEEISFAEFMSASLSRCDAHSLSSRWNDLQDERSVTPCESTCQSLWAHSIGPLCLALSPSLVSSLASVTALIPLFYCRLSLITVVVTPPCSSASLFPSPFVSSYLPHPFSSLNHLSRSHSPRLLSPPLFILTPLSPPRPHSHQTHTESDAQTPSLTSPMSTLLSSCPHSDFLSGSVSAWIPSLMGPHHFRQLQFLRADKQRCGAALRTQLRGIVD